MVQVAIKVIDRCKIKQDYVRDSLYREARILAQLRHPNVVRLYETISVSLSIGNGRFQEIGQVTNQVPPILGSLWKY